MSKTKPSIQKQIDQVKIWLSEGLDRKQIDQRFTKLYQNLPKSEKTITNRIKQAKLQTQPLLDKASEDIDTEIAEREKNAKKRIKEAYIGMVEFQAGLAEDILKVVSQQLEGKNDLAYLTALKTAQKAGLQLKDLAPSLRLENGLPSVVSQNNNNNNNINADDVISKLKNEKTINLKE